MEDPIFRNIFFQVDLFSISLFFTYKKPSEHKNLMT